MARTGLLGLRELIAIGVGGMIGGGIFSVMGLAVEIAGGLAPVAFFLGGILAFVTGYSYIKLATSYHTDGASFTYLEYAFPDRPVIGAFVGWVVVVGYIGTMALYAFTFGAYASELMGGPATGTDRQVLSTAIVAVFMVINLYGVKSTGSTEDLIVYGKILLLGILAFVGLGSVDFEQVQVWPAGKIDAVFMAAALIFVAYEGFQLITNGVCETENPSLNVPRGIYGSILIVMVLYCVLSVVAVGSLSVAQLVEAKEYALAVAVEPAMGNVGRVLVSIAAMLATASAINATMFGSSRMMAEMAVGKEMPTAFSFRNRSQVPWIAVVVVSVLTVVLTYNSGLEFIASFSSMTFLLVSLAVALANLKLHAFTHSNLWLVSSASVLLLATITTLIIYLADRMPHTLYVIATMYGVIGVAVWLFEKNR
ncbi:MAG TPA: APC family permease [Mariprofundaceae bacterium]|nr:APC family permease [Mariprofundaceae bacterium]